MRSLALKLARSPRTLFNMFTDRISTPCGLRLMGVMSGQGCSFTGAPAIKMVAGARIRLGDDVAIGSRLDANPLGLSHPTILAALMPDSYIEIGDGTGISGASIVARRAVVIGARVLIGAGACIWDSDFHPLNPDVRRQHPTRDARSAPITIEDDVFIGARALILKGVRVGRGAVVGAGAVVTRDVPPGQIVAGNPARVVGPVPGMGSGAAQVPAGGGAATQSTTP